MTPTEEALELGNKMYSGDVFKKTKQEHLEELEMAKLRALVIIDEKIKTCNKFYEKLSFPAEVKSDMGYICFEKELDYLNEVRKEVEKLTE